MAGQPTPHENVGYFDLFDFENWWEMILDCGLGEIMADVMRLEGLHLEEHRIPRLDLKFVIC